MPFNDEAIKRFLENRSNLAKLNREKTSIIIAEVLLTYNPREPDKMDRKFYNQIKGIKRSVFEALSCGLSSAEALDYALGERQKYVR